MQFVLADLTRWVPLTTSIFWQREATRMQHDVEEIRSCLSFGLPACIAVDSSGPASEVM